MAFTAKKKPSYEELCAIPETMVGEIIEGELSVRPRPSSIHLLASSGLSSELIGPFHYGKSGGPGGWWILGEPEVHLGDDVFVPDFAGWRRTKMPVLPEGHRFVVPPDWVCEILSPNTAQTDRALKMPAYARCEVPHLWIVDPASRILEVFRCQSNKWLLLAAHRNDEKVRAEPFQEIEVDLSLLWL